MRTFKLLICLLSFQLTLYSLTAWAVPIANLYNTGLDGSGNYLATGNPDGNYTVISSPAGAFVPVAADDTAYPFPFWVANNPTSSRWVGPNAQYSDGPAGNYIYRTSFNLPANTILSSVVITGMWATDDPGPDILVNSTSNAQSSPSYGSLVPFTLTTGFQIGNNDIDFLVQNATGPTGLRIDKIVGSYNIPEPASAALAFLCLGGIVMRRRA